MFFIINVMIINLIILDYALLICYMIVRFLDSDMELLYGQISVHQSIGLSVFQFFTHMSVWIFRQHAASIYGFVCFVLFCFVCFVKKKLGHF